MRLSHDRLRRYPANAVIALAIGIPLGPAAEADFNHVVRLGEFPGIAVIEPFIRAFDLPALAERLAEDAVFVAYAVANRGDVQGRQRIHETGGKPSQATVAQARFDVQFAKVSQVDIVALHRVLRERIGVRVKQVLFQLLADQVFGRQVINEFGILPVVAVDVLLPVVHHVIADGMGEREIQIMLGRCIDGLPAREVEVVAKSLVKGLLGMLHLRDILEICYHDSLPSNLVGGRLPASAASM